MTEAVQSAGGRRRPRFRREEILAAAADLFGRQGYAATSMEDIGRAVGIGGSAIYRHFPSKQDMLLVLYERATDDYVRVLHDVLSRHSDPGERLEALIDVSAEQMVGNSGVLSIVANERVNLPEAARARLSEIHRAIGAEWMDLLTELKPSLPREEARVLMLAIAGLGGFVTQSNTTLSSRRLGELIKSAMRATLWSALGDPGARPRT